MTDSGNVRLARPDDAIQIVSIIRSGFSDLDLLITVVGCRGYSRYVRTQIDVSPEGGESEFWVATEQLDIPVGCLELRDLGRELFLNHIFVLPEHRGSGAGKRLLHSALHRTRSTCEQLMLDVWEDNDAAISWYQRMGFQVQSSSEYRSLSLALGRRTRAFRIVGWPHAIAGHIAYGFSNFQVATSTKQYSIGILGSQWFRVTDPDALTDPDLFDALEALEPGRSMLAVLPAGTTLKDSLERPQLIRKSIRLGASMLTVKEWLAQNI